MLSKLFIFTGFHKVPLICCFLFSRVYIRSRLLIEGFYFCGLTEDSTRLLLFFVFFFRRSPLVYWRFLFLRVNRSGPICLLRFLFFSDLSTEAACLLESFIPVVNNRSRLCFELFSLHELFVLWTFYILRVVICCYILVTLLPIDGSVFLLFTWVAYSICFLVYGSTRLFSLISSFPSSSQWWRMAEWLTLSRITGS